jgi:hypothetical protein
VIHPLELNLKRRLKVDLERITRWQTNKLFPEGAILHWDADLDAFSEQTGGVHRFNHAVLSPQYQLNADGSYSNVGAKPAVDVFGGKKWLRSCGQVTNLLPVGAEASATWFKSGVSLTGYIVTATTSLASHYIQIASYSYVSSKTYTFLYRIKPQYGQRFCQILGSNASFSSAQYAVFDLEAGVVTYSTGGTAFIWQDESDPTRYWCSWAVLCKTSGESKSAAVVFTPNGAAPRLPVYAGDGIASLEIDRWMVTESSVPVPYVPPGITQPASNATTTNGSWFTNPKYIDNVAGAGVGPCPESILPPLMVPMEGCNDPLSPNYGSYTYDNVADMCFIPKFYYKANNTLGYSFGTHGVNTLTIRGSETFASTAAANIAGFALHRAFIDGGIEHPGFFVDKYKCSKVAKGTGFVAGSVKNGLPISTSANHNPISEITSVSLGNMHASCVDAAKGRDGVNGVKNTSSIFAPISVYQRSALALFSLGYGEAADSNEYCAWYNSNGVTNFPKGCNNNALSDTNDTTVTYTSDGYSNCGKTGSGTPFAKTTHNGQACGVTDLNGLLWEVSLGMTCIATTKGITGATQANPCVLTVPGHGLTTGRIIQVESAGSMTQLNNKMYTVNVIDANTISLDGVNSTAYTAYTSGGAIAYGNFYAAKESTRMRDFTSGTALATDHWGAPGVAAMMDEIALQLAAPGGSSMDQKFGNAANQVLSADTSGAGYVLTGIGHPKDINGMSTTGTDLFGKDQIYQYFRDKLCVLSGAHWIDNLSAGVFARYLGHSRYDSYSAVGLRCACYPDTINDPSATPPSILGSKVRSVSPLWSALAGDEVKGSPLTLATRVRMGVGSGGILNNEYKQIIESNTVVGSFAGLHIFGRSSGGVSQVVRASDGVSYPAANSEWSRNSIIRRVTQVNTAGTQFRVGYMIEGTNTAIQWSSWSNFDGSFNPSTLYRLMLGYANAYPMWFNKITAWREQVSDARILEAMS